MANLLVIGVVFATALLFTIFAMAVLTRGIGGGGGAGGGAGGSRGGADEAGDEADSEAQAHDVAERVPIMANPDRHPELRQ